MLLEHLRLLAAASSLGSEGQEGTGCGEGQESLCTVTIIKCPRQLTLPGKGRSWGFKAVERHNHNSIYSPCCVGKAIPGLHQRQECVKEQDDISSHKTGRGEGPHLLFF